MHIHRNGNIFLAYGQLIYSINRNVYLHFKCRSSDSTKYGTNKSSGASVTSGGKSGNNLSSSTTQLHSVSNQHRKPPLHPSRHNGNINNNQTFSISGIGNINQTNNNQTNHQQPIQSHHQNNTKHSSTVSVHNSNNRLINNTVFENNQYTFSLSRISGMSSVSGVGLSPNGYLETRPLSSASIHNGDHTHGSSNSSRIISRGTKSDIGVPVRRQSSSSTSTTTSNSSKNNQFLSNSHSHNKIKSTTIKSDLISYISNNQSPEYFLTTPLSGGGGDMMMTGTTSKHGHHHRTQQPERHQSHHHHNHNRHTDYLENYKNRTKYFNRQQQLFNSTTPTTFGGAGGTVNNTVNNPSTQSLVGPLLYLEQEHLTNRHVNMNNNNNKYYQSLRNVSKEFLE